MTDVVEQEDVVAVLSKSMKRADVSLFSSGSW